MAVKDRILEDSSSKGLARKRARLEESSLSQPIAKNAMKQSKFLSLEAFISNLIFGIFLEDEDDIAETIYSRQIGRRAKQIVNGTELTFQTFKDFLRKTRGQIRYRQLIKTKTLADPDDEDGLTGNVAQVVHFTGNRDNKDISGTVIAILAVQLEQGKRKVEMGHWIFNNDFDPLSKATLQTLRANVFNASHDLLIQDVDEILDIGLEMNWSRRVHEIINGTVFTFNTFHQFLVWLHKDVKSRIVVTEDAIIGDPTTNNVAHIITFSGIHNNKFVEVEMIAIASLGSSGKLSAETIVIVIKEV